jgi:hypothetical protein
VKSGKRKKAAQTGGVKDSVMARKKGAIRPVQMRTLQEQALNCKDYVCSHAQNA